MKVSERWLRSFIDLPLSITDIAEQLTQAGIEVDALEFLPDKQGVLTLKIPPNRGDCLSMEGIARELSLLTEKPYTSAISETKSDLSSISESFPVKLEATDLCPRYLGRVIRDIKPGVATPIWLKERLELAGLRCVSVIVDILNYVMLELGQPLHAFDLNRLTIEIHIRKSKSEETIQLLDGRTVKLEAGTLVIADKNKVQAIAGVIGGLESSVTEETSNLFIESAFFDPIAIRLAAKRYNSRTDASQRFERGVDPLLQESALNRATQLIVEIVGGKAGPIVEQQDLTKIPKNPAVILRKSRIVTVLGSAPRDTDIVKILKRGNMTVEEIKTQTVNSKNMSEQKDIHFKVVAPSYRYDIALEIDLIEEIARVYGYEKFKSENLWGTLEFFKMPEKEMSIPVLKQILTDRGYFEAITYSFIDPKKIELFDPALKPYLLANPISSEMAAMRPTLWVGLLQAVQNNQRRQQMRVRLFEVGNRFTATKESKIVEEYVLSGICAGPVYEEQWGETTRPHDFYDMKGDIQALLSEVEQVEKLKYEPVVHPMLHPGKAAKITLNDKTLGILGALHPRITKSFDVSDPIYVFELNLRSLNMQIPAFRDLSKFPAIRRDIAIVVEKHLFAEEIKSAIVNCIGEWLREVVLFDVYQGPGIESGKKSIALGLILQHPSRTLIEEEVADKMNQVVAMLVTEFHATLRE